MAFVSGGYVISTDRQSFTSQGTDASIRSDTLEEVARALHIVGKDGSITLHGQPVKVSEIVSIHVFRKKS
jgi:hypothetical protein